MRYVLLLFATLLLPSVANAQEFERSNAFVRAFVTLTVFENGAGFEVSAFAIDEARGPRANDDALRQMALSLLGQTLAENKWCLGGYTLTTSRAHDESVWILVGLCK